MSSPTTTNITNPTDSTMPTTNTPTTSNVTARDIVNPTVPPSTVPPTTNPTNITAVLPADRQTEENNSNEGSEWESEGTTESELSDNELNPVIEQLLGTTGTRVWGIRGIDWIRNDPIVTGTFEGTRTDTRYHILLENGDTVKVPKNLVLLTDEIDPSKLKDLIIFLMDARVSIAAHSISKCVMLLDTTIINDTVRAIAENEYHGTVNESSTTGMIQQLVNTMVKHVRTINIDTVKRQRTKREEEAERERKAKDEAFAQMTKEAVEKKRREILDGKEAEIRRLKAKITSLKKGKGEVVEVPRNVFANVLEHARQHLNMVETYERLYEQGGEAVPKRFARDTFPPMYSWALANETLAQQPTEVQEEEEEEEEEDQKPAAVPTQAPEPTPETEEVIATMLSLRSPDRSALWMERKDAKDPLVGTKSIDVGTQTSKSELLRYYGPRRYQTTIFEPTVDEATTPTTPTTATADLQSPTSTTATTPLQTQLMRIAAATAAHFPPADVTTAGGDAKEDEKSAGDEGEDLGDGDDIMEDDISDAPSVEDFEEVATKMEKIFQEAKANNIKFARSEGIIHSSRLPRFWEIIVMANDISNSPFGQHDAIRDLWNRVGIPEYAKPTTVLLAYAIYLIGLVAMETVGETSYMKGGKKHTFPCPKFDHIGTYGNAYLAAFAVMPAARKWEKFRGAEMNDRMATAFRTLLASTINLCDYRLFKQSPTGSHADLVRKAAFCCARTKDVVRDVERLVYDARLSETTRDGRLTGKWYKSILDFLPHSSELASIRYPMLHRRAGDAEFGLIQGGYVDPVSDRYYQEVKDLNAEAAAADQTPPPPETKRPVIKPSDPRAWKDFFVASTGRYVPMDFDIPEELTQNVARLPRPKRRRQPDDFPTSEDEGASPRDRRAALRKKQRTVDEDERKRPAITTTATPTTPIDLVTPVAAEERATAAATTPTVPTADVTTTPPLPVAVQHPGQLTPLTAAPPTPLGTAPPSILRTSREGATVPRMVETVRFAQAETTVQAAIGQVMMTPPPRNRAAPVPTVAGPPPAAHHPAEDVQLTVRNPDTWDSAWTREDSDDDQTPGGMA